MRLPWRGLAIGLAAVILAALAVETTVRDLIRQSGIPVAVAWLPDDARMVLRRAGLDEATLLNRRDLPASALGPARQARALDPLDPLPLVIAGMVARSQGQGKAAITDFQTAKRIDPRLFLARYQLMQQLVEVGSVGDAVDEIIAGANLVTDYDPALLPALASASTAPDLRARIFAGLRRYPDVRQRMIKYASTSPDGDALLPDLLLLGADRDSIDAAIANLANRGEVGRAMALWRSTYRPDRAAFTGFVFDGAFNGRSAPPTMGWQKLADPHLSVAIGTPDGAASQLQVTAYGPASATPVVSQLLVLPPGVYQLFARTGDSNSPGSEGGFTWTIACADNLPALATLPFDAMTETRRTKGVQFTVPADCPRQLLKLTTAPTDVSTTYSIAFDTVMVRRP